MAALYAEIPRIRAERLLDAAQAASFPHLSKEGRARWLRSAGRFSRRAATAAAATQHAGLTWNGVPIPSREAFKARLAFAFGGELPGARPTLAMRADGTRPAYHPASGLGTNGTAD